MHELGCRTMQEYSLALDQNKDAMQPCERLMTVSISRFFRDRGLWQTLENEILPTIIKENRRRVKVWSKEQTYAVAERLKKGIGWRCHNLLFDLPRTHFQLVFLRNSLLTYYEDEVKRRGFHKVFDSLAQSGFLIIGAHEKTPPWVRGLLPFGHYPCIFQKRPEV